MSDNILLDKLNKGVEKNYPPPEVYPNIYIDYKICPICLEVVDNNGILHPNDINKKLWVHNYCWEFVKKYWKCRKCKKWFSGLPYSLPELNHLCENCFRFYHTQIQANLMFKQQFNIKNKKD